MVIRRDRHLKKRKPKLYPATNIKTRSMEHQKKNESWTESLELEFYSEMIQNSSQCHDSGVVDLYLFENNESQMEQLSPVECVEY